MSLLISGTAIEGSPANAPEDMTQDDCRFADEAHIDVPDLSGMADGGRFNEAAMIRGTDFPCRLLPCVAGTMTTEIARVTTSNNMALAGAAVLGVISASIGSGLVLQTGGERRTLPNLFLLGVAQSGTGKGESFKLASEPFDAFERALVAQYEQELPELLAEMEALNVLLKGMGRRIQRPAGEEAEDGADEMFVDLKMEKIELQRRIDRRPRLKVGDTTKEALAVLMEQQPGQALASMSCEARGLIHVVNGKYNKNGGDEDFYCSAYSSEPILVDRISRDPVRLERPCLTVAWLIQPDAGASALSRQSLTESGMIPRFISFEADADPKERNAYPSPIRPAVKEGWGELIHGLLIEYRANGDQPRLLEMTPEAKSVMIAYENENIRRRRRGGDLHDLAAYVARWSENAAKLALVLHAARQGVEAHLHPVDEDIALRAVGLMRWFSERQLLLLAPGRRDRVQKRLTKLLAVLATVGGEMTLRDLRRSHSFDEDELLRLCDAYPGSFSIIEKRPAGGGRPSYVASTRAQIETPTGGNNPDTKLN